MRGGGCRKSEIVSGDVGFVVVALRVFLADIGVGANGEAVEWIGGFGGPFAETGEMSLEEWTSRFDPRSLDSGEPLPLERRPTGFALYQRRASHERYLITSLDGVERRVAVTALPLFAHADEFVGIVAIFWRE